MGLFDKFRKKVRDAASDIDSESISAEDGTQEAIDALAKHGENKIESPIESGSDDDWEDIDDDEELNLPSTNDDDWDDWDEEEEYTLPTKLSRKEKKILAKQEKKEAAKKKAAEKELKKRGGKEVKRLAGSKVDLHMMRTTTGDN